MVKTRVTMAIILSAVGLILSLLNDTGLTEELGLKLSLVGITGFLLAIVAFAVAVDVKAYLIAGILTAQGIVMSVAAAVNGAAIGVWFGVLLTLLGLIKAAISYRIGNREKPGVENHEH